MTVHFRFRKRSRIALFLVFVVSVVSYFFLERTVGGQSVDRPGIRPGSVVSRFVAHEVNGVTVTVDFTDELPTLLYVFSPECAWSDRNYDNIVALATMLSSQFRFIGLADSEYGAEVVASYLQEYPLPFDALLLDSSRAGLDLSVTPQTVVVRSGGKVQHAWNGALFGRKLSYAEYVFDVRLPGLSGPPTMAVSEGERSCWSDHGETSAGGVARIEGVLSVCRAGRWVPVAVR